MVPAHYIKELFFAHGCINLTVDDHRISILLENVSPKLLAADDLQRSVYKISPSGYGIHWPLIDEDLSVVALLKQAEG